MTRPLQPGFDVSQEATEMQAGVKQTRHLHFVQALDPLRGGGMGATALELHKEFLSLGVMSRLISTRREDEEPAEAPGVIQFVRRGIDKTFYVPGLRGMVESMVAEADVVHGHGFYVDINRVLGAMAREFGKPLVYHAHGILEPWVLERSPRKKAIVNRLFETKNCEYAALWRALTPSEVTSIRRYGITAPIVVAPNGIRVEQFSARGPGGRSELGKFTLLFLGRLHAKKGVDLLVQAWAGSPHMHRDWELVIAGPDEDGYGKTIARLVVDLDLTRSVTLLGTVSGQRKTEVLNRASAAIVPSRSEGFPTVILEAMASRLPVVATRAANFAGIEDHRSGFECESSVPSIKSALVRLAGTSLEELSAMGARGRDWVECDYLWTSSARRILEATETLVT